ncbi:MAG: (Fe-S)-binding protein [Bacteroidota bacterium]|nr:(Fe-S)-binding protein [Bacteroidota bacterium]
MKDNGSVSNDILKQLPSSNCGGCGFKTCQEFAMYIPEHPEEAKRCTHLQAARQSKSTPSGIGDLLQHRNQQRTWLDNLQRPYDFILECFENDPGPRETILPYNPQLVKELGVKKGDIMIGRPMGMSCGCPITHCGIVTGVDPRNGVINWCVTGPLRPRTEGFIDIGYYVAQAYDGIIREANTEIKLGKRYWFLPRRCMLQWRHSGLVNAVTRLKDGSIKIRVEGLFIG